MTATFFNIAHQLEMLADDYKVFHGQKFTFDKYGEKTVSIKFTHFCQNPNTKTTNGEILPFQPKDVLKYCSEYPTKPNSDFFGHIYVKDVVMTDNYLHIYVEIKQPENAEEANSKIDIAYLLADCISGDYEFNKNFSVPYALQFEESIESISIQLEKRKTPIEIDVRRKTEDDYRYFITGYTGKTHKTKGKQIASVTINKKKKWLSTLKIYFENGGSSQEFGALNEWSDYEKELEALYNLINR